MLEIRLLGPLEVLDGGETVHLARRQQRVILGALSLQPNQIVSRDSLIDCLWPARAPERAAAIVQSRISELRALVGRPDDRNEGVGLATQGNAYVLRAPVASIDAGRFLAKANASHDLSTTEGARLARQGLREALGLWRGAVLGGILGESADEFNELCQNLEAARLTALEDLFDVELRLDAHQAIATEVAAASAAHPTRERLAELSMLALYRAGRAAEALKGYEQRRRWLREELGTDPDPGTKQLHLAILENDATLLQATPDGTERITLNPLTAAPPSNDRSEAPEPLPQDRFQMSVPHTLPPDISDFAGRETERSHLAALLASGAGSSGQVIVISGRGGIGKSALAVRTAHALRERFEDGQLYLDLRGFDSTRPVQPSEALGRFLRALGVDGATVPETLEGKIDLYRDLLFDRRVLIVLDNAATDDQVLPLVPAGADCAVIVTSRARLGTTFGAHLMQLDVLETREATALLARIAGPGRHVTGPLADKLANQCGNLPLAIRIAGAKLAAKPHWDLQRVIDLLGEGQRRLDQFKHEHLDVRASIDLSYSSLSPQARALLQGIGIVDLSEISSWTCCAIVDANMQNVEALTEELFDAQLLDMGDKGVDGRIRFRIHDLVRIFAQECAAREQTNAEMRAIVERAAAAWLFAAQVAYRSMHGGDFQNIVGDAPRYEIDAKAVDAIAQSPLRWIEAERIALVAITERTGRENLTELCWELATTSSWPLQVRRLYDDWHTVLNAALRTCTAANDRRGRAAMLYRLGMFTTDRQDYPQARAYFNESEELFTILGDRHGKAVAGTFKAMALRLGGDLNSAQEAYDAILPIVGMVSDPGLEAFALRGIGQIQMSRGDLEGAQEAFRNALIAAESTRSPYGQSPLRFWQGMLALRQGDEDGARVAFDATLALCKRTGDRTGEAQALRGIGLWHSARREYDAALRYLDEALTIVRQPRPTLLEECIREEMSSARRQQDADGERA